MAARGRVVRVHVAAAVVLSLLFAGCTSSTSGGTDVDEESHDDLGLAAAPVLYLNLTIGNDTHRFTSADAAAPSGASGSNGTTTIASNSTSAASNATAGNATAGNATAGNSTDTPGGDAPLAVSVTLGASKLAAGKNATWQLDFGASPAVADGNGTAGNGTAGNATADNATESAPSVANGTKLPGEAGFTYTEPGTYEIEYVLRQGNTTLASMHVALVVGGSGNATNATAFGPLPEPIVIEGSTSGLNGLPGSATESFDLTAPVQTMTITLEYNDRTGQGLEDIDWHITGPGGESADGTNSGYEDPATFELPTVGTWNVEIVPFSALQTAYTITVTFT
jgi:hypothetical protein